MKRLSLISIILLLVTSVAFADDVAKLSARTFQFKFKEADKAAAMIKPLLSAEGSMSIQPSSNSLVITDRAENLKSIAAALVQFDSAAKTFHLEVRLVSASRNPSVTTTRAPREIEDVAKQLAILRYNSFENLGEMDVEGKEGEPGIIETATGYRADFKFGEYDPASDSIKVSDFRLSRIGGAQKSELTQLYKTSLNLKLGQTLILGASKPQGGKALMIVVVAKR